MTLFELAASLGLDISAFETNATNAETRAKNLESSLNELDFPDLTSGNLADLDAAIAALDEEIAELDEEIEALELDLEIDNLDQQNSQMEAEISNSEKRVSALSGIVEGIAEASADFVVDLMNDAFDFVAEGFEKAANSGSELAGRYQEQMNGLSATTDIIQDKVGTTLLDLAVDGLNLYENIDNVLSRVFDISEQDKLNASLKRLSEYEFSNLEQARETLNGMFSIGDNVDLSPVEMSFEDALKSYEQQQLYWEEYDKVFSSLRDRGVSDDILMQYTGGYESDFMMLQWYSNLTDSQLAELEAARAQVEQAESSAAETITELKLATDDAYKKMQEEAEYYETQTKIGSDIHLTDGDRYAGSGGRRFGAEYGPGLPDDFESDVQSIEEAGKGIETAVSNLQSSIDALPGTISGAISGAQVTMDGQVVGTIVFPYVSSEFRRLAVGMKYTASK